jgi:hypothetical protein
MRTTKYVAFDSNSQFYWQNVWRWSKIYKRP